MALARVVILLLVAMLTGGCTSVTAGTVRPAPGMKPRPLGGSTIKQVLLDDAQLSRILNQSFKTDSALPPWFGGPEQLRQAYGPSTRDECLGVTTAMEESAYQSAKVNDVAGETWWNSSGPAKVLSVAEGVITLPTAADADALFAKFSQQWQQCDGATLTLQGGRISFDDTITGVRVANSVLAANVSVASRLTGSIVTAIPEVRAIGVRVNCLVEVEVAFYSSRGPADQGSGDINTSAIDLAHVMMDKISGLT
jgi:hypothetical protein